MHWSSAALPTYLYGDKMQGSSVRSENGNIVLMERPTSLEASSSRPPPVDAWRQAWEAAMPELKRLHTLQKGLSPIPISRVNQFDAARLDVEMTAMLREQLMKVFSLMQPGLLSRYEPELNAFLEFLVFRFSIWLDRPTPGNALMNLRYRDERAFSRLAATGRDRNIILRRENSIGLWPCPSLEQPGECSEEHVRTGLEGPGLTKYQKVWYCLAMVGGRYGWSRLQMISAFQRWGDSDQSSWARRAWVLLQKAESFYKIASCFNLMVFLLTGRYRSIVERILRARLVYVKPNMNRTVSFEYMNQQLVWHEFSELVLLVLPLLNIFSMKGIMGFPFSRGQSSDINQKEDACPICDACPITVAYKALPCSHLYCYFCLSTRCIASKSFKCVRCDAAIVAIKRHHVQIGMPGQQD